MAAAGVGRAGERGPGSLGATHAWMGAPRLPMLLRSCSQALVCYLGPPSHLFWNILPMTLGVLAVTLGAILYGAQGGPTVYHPKRAHPALHPAAATAPQG